ncbi:hypothetical protein SAMN05216206_0180 [Pseudomonas guineae]|uniref:PasA protein n=1 Tax=Pseudomonas guineae TaxID=425504 RepID=A0A1I3CQJ8_9PSED|nr:DUF6586 family protein [Pseudomonas guineae]SFH76531.1 hypothetical protein SAMN05216206_0180 [Pseudomonas guineae]
MANELYTRTNQKIFYAGLALESWRKAEQGQSMNALALIQAEREAALFHLYGALLGLCHEIAGYYRLPDSAAPRAESFLTSVVLSAAPSQELGELVELAQSKESWVAQLLSAYAALFKPPQAGKKSKVDPTTPLITAVSLDEDVEPLAHQSLEIWRQELKALAQRFRETLSEW